MTETISLKALANKVLQRNKSRNRSETSVFFDETKTKDHETRTLRHMTDISLVKIDLSVLNMDTFEADKDVNAKVKGSSTETEIDLDRYVMFFERHLNELKGVFVFSSSLTGHSKRYTALSNTYFTLLEENKLTYKDTVGYDALMLICDRVGYWPFK